MAANMVPVILFLLMYLTSHAADGSYTCTYSCYGSTCTTYCDHGCCGSYYDRYCCTNFSNVGTIAGIIIGCIIFIGLLVATIAFCVIACQKRHNQRGLVRPVDHYPGQSQSRGNFMYTSPVPKPHQAPVPPPYAVGPPPGYSDLYPQNRNGSDPTYPPPSGQGLPRMNSPAPPYSEVSQSGSINQHNPNIWTVQSNG